MKKIIPIFSIAIVMAACTSNPKENTSSVIPSQVEQQAPVFNPDTVGLAQFQQWKAQHELATVEEYNQPAHYVTAAPVKKIKKVPNAPVHKTVISAPTPEKSTAETNTSVSSPSADTKESGAISTESSESAKVPEKKGWSKAAKGTAIGAGTGAAAGAIIFKKNRAAGAVIGGVVGGAVGYGVGRDMDKKDNR
ncbi:MAG: glycine zipper domain-containing protein [Bacteroidota bacterium]|nr:glycine zipper domain-containing protein [Bacteroidota bacterium]